MVKSYQIRNERAFLKPAKGTMKNPQLISFLIMKDECFSPKIRNKAMLFTIYFYLSLNSISSKQRNGKELENKKKSIDIIR